MDATYIIVLSLAIIVFLVIFLGLSTYVRSRKEDRAIDQRLWMTVHRVAMRHGIVIPEGMSLDEAGTYVEQMIDAAGQE